MSREAGKGSRPRPFSVPQEEYGQRWEMAFKRPKQKETEDYQDILETEDCVLGSFQRFKDDL